MNALLFYLMQSSVCLGLLFGVYWGFLRRDTFFQMNRAFLLMAVVFSIIIPAFPFHHIFAGPVAKLVVFLDPVLITPGRIEKAVSSHFQWFGTLQVIYFTGVMILMVRFLLKLFLIVRLVCCSVVKKTGRGIQVMVDRLYSPFSFFNMVFLNERSLASEDMKIIMVHEQVHMRQAHTVDLLLAEVLIIVQWFNPFAWLTCRELKNIHEYLADEGVIRKGVPAAGYQQLILNETMGMGMSNLTNNFNISQLKNRISMMTQKRSGRWAISKITLALPAVVAVGLIFSASTFNHGKALERNAPEVKNTSVAVAAPDTSKYQVPDKQPVFPGGDEARSKFIAENIKYPPEAMKNKVTGKVFVSFNVAKNGSVTDVKLIKGIGSGCDEEAVRVVKLMPKWKPGEYKGKPVETNFVIPIKFALDCDKKDGQKTEVKYLAPVVPAKK